jgi:hypothetical protein
MIQLKRLKTQATILAATVARNTSEITFKNDTFLYQNLLKRPHKATALIKGTIIYQINRRRVFQENTSITSIFKNIYIIYLAISITLVSLIRFTLTSPGYESFSCIFSAISFAISAACRSETVFAFTNTLISLPALRANALSTQEKL